jgi:hypothetical protein
MGAKLVAAAFMLFGRDKPLNDRPFRVLVHMCLTIKDDNDPPTYWGGTELLTYALGVAPDDSGRRMARRAVADLETAGAIVRANRPARGRRAEYRLTFTAATVVDKLIPGLGKPDALGGLVSPLMGDSPVRIGGLVSPDRGTRESPQGVTEEPTEEHGEDQQRLRGARHVRPVPPVDNPQPDSPPTLDQLIARAKKEGRL